MAGSRRWLPVLHADDGQADLALLVDVGVVDFCLEGDLGRLEGILGGEDDLDPKRSFVVRRTVLKRVGEAERGSVSSEDILNRMSALAF